MKNSGVVFGDIFMVLVISTIVVILSITGAAISYKNLTCYTGVNGFLESPGAHLGTVLNSKVVLTVEDTIITSYSQCESRCSETRDNCNTLNAESETNDCEEVYADCEGICASNFSDKNKMYLFFYTTLSNQGTVAAHINVSESTSLNGVEKVLWYVETEDMGFGDSIHLTTKPIPINSNSLKCDIILKAVPMGTGILPAEKTIKTGDTWRCIG